MAEQKLTKAERREAARAKSEAIRAKQAAAEKRQKTVIWSVLGVVVLALAGVIVFLIANNARQNAGNFAAPSLDASIRLADVADVPTSARADGGILVGPGGTAAAVPVAGVPELGVYLDYLCPACYQFEASQLENLVNFMDHGTANVVLYPMGMLGADSARLAAAAAWVADNAPEHFFAYHVALFENVIGGQTPRNDNAGLAAIAEGVGVPADVAEGIRTGESFYRFGQWAASSAQHFVTIEGFENPANGQRGTPTIAIDGVRWWGDWPNSATALPNAIAEATS
ncbi:MAG: thioredoxin domain-containing protein [Promicromonosporaceae bacterium]|nr:thioredoxin domain-containing protein [Promicromonosporaceae bacterium]